MNPPLLPLVIKSYSQSERSSAVVVVVVVVVICPERQVSSGVVVLVVACAATVPITAAVDGRSPMSMSAGGPLMKLNESTPPLLARDGNVGGTSSSGDLSLP